MEDIVRDALEKGLISFGEDWIVKALRNPQNWGKISLELATSIPDRSFTHLDLLDFYIMLRESSN